YNNPDYSDEGASALAVDEQGNVYVTRTNISSGTGSDYATLKYDPNGKLLWEQRYNGPSNGDDQVSALVVDEQGNVYVTGNSMGNGTGSDYATLKYDSNGNLLWEQRYNGPGNYYDYAYALALDKQGNVYVTGASWGNGTGYDYTTLKYDPNGNLLWEQRYNGPSNDYDYARALAIDARSNIYVTGYSPGNGTKSDYVTLKYDSNGNLLWEQRYNGLGNDEDVANAIAVDKQGVVFQSWILH
ncbi:MAG TPA: SBBP repeat-containing protein, partial [Saprospiraceae bacterium]|nr:SBBP repeat-containing protein [Saprospiraceae bacterium]